MYRVILVVSFINIAVIWLAFSIYLNRRGKSDARLREYSEVYSRLKIAEYAIEQHRKHNKSNHADL
jgi:hypothetical protein